MLVVYCLSIVNLVSLEFVSSHFVPESLYLCAWKYLCKLLLQIRIYISIDLDIHLEMLLSDVHKMLYWCTEHSLTFINYYSLWNTNIVQVLLVPSALYCKRKKCLLRRISSFSIVFVVVVPFFTSLFLFVTLLRH